MSETALMALSKIRIRHMVDEGVRGSKLVEKLSQDPSKLLGAILIGNNIVNIGASALATSIAVKLIGPSGVGIVTIVMTILVLIFGEITPKSIAKQNSEKVSLFVSKPIGIIVKVFNPLVIVFTSISSVFIRLLGGDPKATEPFITEEDHEHLSFKNGDYIFVPDIRKAVEDKDEVIHAYVIGDEITELSWKLGELTDVEREIILKGCLINYYRG